MPEPTTIPSLNALRGQRAAEEAHARGRNKRDYLKALDAAYHASRVRIAEIHGVAVPPTQASIRDAIRSELAALDAAQRVRPEIAAWLGRIPPADVKEPRPVADAVRQLRGGAQAGLKVLDEHPATLQRWLDIIAQVPDDVGSADALALEHCAKILDLLGAAQRMQDLPAVLARQGEELEGLAHAWLGAPSEFRPGIGPREALEPDAAAHRPRRARGALSGDAA